jgi:hypothetical protein
MNSVRYHLSFCAGFHGAAAADGLSYVATGGDTMQLSLLGLLNGDLPLWSSTTVLNAFLVSYIDSTCLAISSFLA